MEEKYYNYFKTKLEKLPDLRKYASSIDNPEFEKWWGSIKATCERMGPSYIKRANRIHFFPMVLAGGDNSAAISSMYQSGLNQAGAFLESLMEELQTWGLDTLLKNNQPSSNDADKFNLYLTISQQQAQQIIQTINLDDYDEEVRERVQDLFAELKKKDKDKSKIATIVKWLADKSVDALIAILLAKASLT